jgi:hypothetical protein
MTEAHSAEVIQLAAFRPKAGKRPAHGDSSQQREVTNPQFEEGLSDTAKNGKLREKRKELWRMAEAATRYWRVRLTFHDALALAQSMEISEGHYHPIVDSDDRMPMVRQWRSALARQVLTPAPDANSVKWKQALLDSGDFENVDVKTERVERAIADDVEFLEAHPTRRSIAASRQSSKPDQEQ